MSMQGLHLVIELGAENEDDLVFGIFYSREIAERFALISDSKGYIPRREVLSFKLESAPDWTASTDQATNLRERLESLQQ